MLIRRHALYVERIFSSVIVLILRKGTFSIIQFMTAHGTDVLHNDCKFMALLYKIADSNNIYNIDNNKIDRRIIGRSNRSFGFLRMFLKKCSSCRERNLMEF